MPVKMRAFSTHRVHPGHHVVRDMETLNAMVTHLHGHELILDTETNGLEWWADSKPVGIALTSAQAEGAFYVPFGHYTGERQLTLEQILPALKKCVFATPRLIMHNAKFDLHMLRTIGIEPTCDIYCTMVAAHFVDEHRSKRLKDRAADDVNMPQLRESEKLLDREVKAVAKYSGETKTQHLDRYGYSRLSVQMVGDYACWDVEGTRALYLHYEQSHRIGEIYGEIFKHEMALIRAAVAMEAYGLRVDLDYLRELQVSLSQNATELESRIAQTLGDVNLNAPASLAKALKKLGVKLDTATQSGVPSVSKSALETHADDYPIVQDILAWRSATKLRNTYADALIERATDGVVHAHFSTVGARTGRMSCSTPNLQAIPREHENEDGIDPDSVRRSFLVPENRIRIFADYSQMEMRVLAEYSRDAELLNIFENDQDVHTETAIRVFGSEEHRQIAKAINFGLVYGMSATGLGYQLGCSKEAAQAHLKKYFARFAGVKKYKDSFCEWLRQNRGEFLNLFGRPHRIHDISHRDYAKRAQAERRAINYLVQGTAADMMKLALIRVHQELAQTDAHIVLTVHDELQVDCAPESTQAVMQVMQRHMTQFTEVQAVKLKVDFATSRTHWAGKERAA